MPKVWLAIFFGYEGTNYYGMQYQKQTHIKTIEDQLIKILKKGQFLLTDNYFDLTKHYKWSRAARTDKGVHALINGVSALFNIPQQCYDSEQLLQKSKLQLKFKQLFQDTDLVFHSVKRVTTRFQMRQLVKARIYSYICPIRFFVSQKINQQQSLKKINEACKKFIGTHNFHNYSKDIKAKDPKAQRYIVSFTCQQINNQFYRFQIKGQSFIYHQIRKIIGAIIYIFVNQYNSDFLDNTFFRNQLDIPLAPPYGLYLQELCFDSYNMKKDIPQKIIFQQESISKLRENLIKSIISMDNSLWDKWFQDLKDNKLPKLEKQFSQEIIDDQ